MQSNNSRPIKHVLFSLSNFSSFPIIFLLNQDYCFFPGFWLLRSQLFSTSSGTIEKSWLLSHSWPHSYSEGPSFLKFPLVLFRGSEWDSRAGSLVHFRRVLVTCQHSLRKIHFKYIQKVKFFCFPFPNKRFLWDLNLIRKFRLHTVGFSQIISTIINYLIL